MWIVTPVPIKANKSRTHHNEVKNTPLKVIIVHIRINVRILARFDKPSPEK